MIEYVRNNMFTPLAVQKAHKGMQGSDYFEGVELEQAKQLWVESAELALQQAEKMEKFGITKQLINRILEPYQYYQVLVTATEWKNFFELRCPKYKLPKNVYNVFGEDFYEKEFKSIKDLKKSISNYLCNAPKAKQVIKDFNVLSDLGKLKINKGAAEIHMMALAECMWDVYNESAPKQLEVGQWHIPFGDTFNTLKQEDDLEDLLNDINYIPKNTLFNIDFLTQAKLAIATARCARISYETLGDNPEINYEKDIKLHDDLLVMKHFSPFEHCAVVMNEENYYSHIKTTKAKSFTISNNDDIYIDGPISFKDCGWSRNFKGFKQYREIIE